MLSPTRSPSARIALLSCCVFLAGCVEEKSRLETIRERGVLRIVMAPGPAMRHYRENQENSLEYRLADLFAARLGVEFTVTEADSAAAVIERLASGRADLAVGGPTRTFSAQDPLDYGPGYRWVTRQVVYRNGYKRPASLDDIHPYQLHAAGDTLSATEQEQLRVRHPSLDLVLHKDRNARDLLELAQDGEFPYAVAYSSELRHARLSNPEVRAAFDLAMPFPLGWAVTRDRQDSSLIDAVRAFYGEIDSDGRLAELVEQVEGHTRPFDYVDSRKFVDQYHRRLPGLKFFFKNAAAESDLDWRLLAAVSYQESHWLKTARSPTGVRGLMMLTRTTARQLGIDNRLDPEQSIHGGARYLRSLADKMPAQVTEPDRTWFALAAYNVGLGHLEDARVLAQREGGDPNAWADVKEALPLLTQKKWYRQTKYGYARGREPVKFVENIRKYHAILLQLTAAETAPETPPEAPPAPAAQRDIIESPVL